MSDEIMLVFGEDGVAQKYDDTWDITIHCESEEEQKAVLEKLNNSNQEPQELSNNSPKPDKEDGDLQPTCNQLATDAISRTEAIDAVRKCSVKEVTPAFMLVDKAEVMTELMMLPSAQPKIVKCKDCKYRGGLSGCYCDIVEKMVGVDSFCSWAERRTDDQSK